MAFRIGEGYVEVSLRDNTAADIARIRARLAGLDTDIDVGINDQTEADIARIRERLAGLDTTATVRVRGDGIGGAGRGVTGLISSLIRAGAAGQVASAGLGVAAQAAASLGGSAASLAGLLPVVAGGLVAAGIASSTLKSGLDGVGDALGESDPKKYAKKLAELTPAAQSFVKALKPIKDGLHDLNQETLFEGLTPEVERLSSAYLPMASTALKGISTQFNLAAKDATLFAREGGTVKDVNTILGNTQRAVSAARPSVINLAAAFRDVSTVGTAMLPGLSRGWTDATARFRTFISEARKSGQLHEWINQGVGTLRQLGSVAGNVGSVLGSVFKAAKSSGADFLTTLERGTGVLATFMKSGEGQTALVAFFRESRTTIDALVPGLERAATTVSRFVQSFSGTGGLQAAGRALTDLVTAAAPLGATLGPLAGQTLVNLASGASSAAGALGPLVSAFNLLVTGMGPVAPAILAIVIAAKGLSSVGAMVTAQGAAVAATSAKWGLYTTAVTGSMAAGGAAATAVTRLGQALSFVGRAIPIIGAVTVAISLLASSQQDAAAAAQEHQGAIDGLKGTLDKVTGAATNATVAMQAQDIASRTLSDGTTHFASAIAQAGIDLKDYTAAAGGNEQALGKVNAQLFTAAARTPGLQALYAQWKPRLDAAGVSFDTLTAAAIGNGGAFDELTSKLGVSGSGFDVWRQDLAKAVGPVGELGAALGQYSGTLAEAQQQTRDAAAGMKDFGTTLDAIKIGLGGLASGAPQTDVLRAGFRDLATSASDAAMKAGEAAAQVGGVAAGASAAAGSMQQSRDAFIQAAQAAGLTEQQAGALANQIGLIPASASTTFTTNASGVNAELITLKAQLDAVPGAKTITVQSLTDEAKVKLSDLGFTVTALPDGTVQVTANTDAAKANLNAAVSAIQGTTATLKIDGDIDPATGKIRQSVSLANGSKGTITVDANPSPADGKIHGTVSLADGSTGTITIDANQQPANGKIDATVTYADGSTGTIKVEADAAAANSAIDNAARDRTSTIHVRTVQEQTSHIQQGGKGLAAGGYLRPMAKGGLIGPTRYATGGLRPMSATSAEIVAPNTWRIIGDRMRGDEAFIPIDPSDDRAQSILDVVADRMNRTLLPEGQSVGSYMTDLDSSWARKAAALDPETEAGKIAAAHAKIVDAIKDEISAQKALQQAREDASRALEDLQEKVSDYAIDEEAASITVARAKERLDKMRVDKGATALDLREAQNAYDAAVERQQDLADQHYRDLQDLAEAQDAGVEGSDQVTSAKDRLEDARNGVTSSNVGLKTTKKAIKEAKKKKSDEEFDSGGMAYGRGLLSKDTLRPERVLSPHQTVIFERMVAALERHSGPGGRGDAPVTVNVIQQSGSPAETGRMVVLALRGVG